MRERDGMRDLKWHCECIAERITRWKCINENGCNDPFWPDGCNMNLVRNHIIYHRKEIEEICNEMECSLPPEYYLPIPPEAPNNYMANLKQKERVDRLTKEGYILQKKKNKYDEQQLRFV